jgi:hypothetical protein
MLSEQFRREMFGLFLRLKFFGSFYIGRFSENMLDLSTVYEERLLLVSIHNAWVWMSGVISNVAACTH